MLPFSYSIPHSSFPFFIHEINFTFSPSIAPTPNSYQYSSLYLLKIISLSAGHLTSTLFSYNSLNCITPLLILVHLQLIMVLWGKLYLRVWVCFLGSVVLFRQHQQNSTQDVVGELTLSQPAARKDPRKNDPTTIKTQLHVENQHKRHKGHPKNIKFK